MTKQTDLDIKRMRQNAQAVSKLLKLMSNENRLLILCHLSQGELSVTTLNERIDLSQSALSQHLGLLRREGLVKTRRQSQTIYYSLASPEAARLLEFMHGEFCAEPGNNLL